MGRRKVPIAQLLLCQVFLSGVLLAEDPCNTEYMLYTDGERDPEYVPTEDDKPICDIRAVRWYRMKGPQETDLDMSLAPPPVGGCNTAFPIWLNGELPVNDVEVTLIACIQFSATMTCGEELHIGVKNCGDYRVYRLANPGFCPSGYCFDYQNDVEDLPCPIDIPGSVRGPFIRTKLGDSDASYGDENVTFQEIQFECQLQYPDPNRFYDIFWYLNGIQIFTNDFSVIPGGELSFAVLREHHWEDRFKLGMMVRCSIAARYNQSCIPGIARHSADYFAGIKVLDQSVAVNPGELARVGLQATVPIGSFAIGGIPRNAPLYFFAKRGDHNNFCPPSSVEIPDDGQMCGPIFQHNPVSGQYQTMNVTSMISQVYGNKITHIEVTGQRRWPVKWGKTDVWENVRLPLITVNVVTDIISTKGRFCSAQTDPQMNNFDNRYYSNQLEGEFIMYRHKQLPYVVQIMQQRCPVNHFTTCVCGIAVQSGSEIFVYSTCHGEGQVLKFPKVKTYNCFSGGMKIINTSPTSSPHFEIIFPTGTKVSINGARPRVGFLDVAIYPSPSDVYQTVGLCGTLDDNQCNDFIHRNGEGSTSCSSSNAFIQSWSVREDERLYVGNYSKDWEANVTHCLCGTDGVILCTDHLPTQDCIRNSSKDLTDMYSKVCKQKREAHLEVEEDDLPLPDYDHDFLPEDPSWENGWNENDARDFCTRYITDPPFSELCESVNIDVHQSVETCMMDILLSGDTTWTFFTLESFKDQCAETVMKNESYWFANNGTKSVLENVTQQICPSECNFRGSCVDGHCICDPDFTGGDCSIDTTLPPKDMIIPKFGHCDMASRPCIATKLYGEAFLDSSSLKCRMKEYHVDSTGIYPTDNTQYTVPTLLSINELICTIPTQLSQSEYLAQPPYLITFMISISNDGNKFSEDVLFLPYDTTCFMCESGKNNATCFLKDGFCFIEYACISENAIDPGRPTYYCDPNQSKVSWTQVPTTTKQPTKQTTKLTTTTLVTTTTKPTTTTQAATTTKLTTATQVATTNKPTMTTQEATTTKLTTTNPVATTTKPTTTTQAATATKLTTTTKLPEGTNIIPTEESTTVDPDGKTNNEKRIHACSFMIMFVLALNILFVVTS